MRRHREAPLAQEREEFLLHLHQRGTRSFQSQNLCEFAYSHSQSSKIKEGISAACFPFWSIARARPFEFIRNISVCNARPLLDPVVAIESLKHYKTEEFIVEVREGHKTFRVNLEKLAGVARFAKAQSHTADAHALEESDRAILSMKQTNKEERSSAETGEKRARAKENIV